MKARIRIAGPEDEAAVLDCLRIAFDPYRGFYSNDGFMDTVFFFFNDTATTEIYTIFVAEIDNKTVGTIACTHLSGAEGHIRGMAVLPDFHGLGIAEDLLSKAEETIRGWGCNRVTLDTTQVLQRAIRFYEKHGYRRTGPAKDFFGVDLFDYEKPL